MPKASRPAAVLPISIPLQGHPGGRSDFLTNPIQAGSLADLGDEANTVLDEELRKMAGDVTRKHPAGSKHAHDDEINKDDEGEDGDGSMFEDLDEVVPTTAKRAGKAKSPAKLGPACWPPAEVDGMYQNR